MALSANISRDGVGNLIKQVYITKSTAATHSLIAATIGKRIKILRLIASADDAVVASMLSGTDGMFRLDFTTESLIVNLVSSDGVCVAITTSGAALQVTLSGAIATYFYIQYVLVD